MKLETFITNYMTDGSKEKYVKSVIKKDYVPYTEKCSDCERIARSCHYGEMDGKRRFAINSPAQAMMFALVLVDRYTKIDVEYGTDAYDELQKCGALGMLIAAMPEPEYQEYSTIMHMIEEDLIMSETSVASRLDDLIQAANSVLAATVEGLDRAIAQGGENGADLGSD